MKAYYFLFGSISFVASMLGGMMVSQNRYGLASCIMLMAAGAIWVSAANAFPLKPPQ